MLIPCAPCAAAETADAPTAGSARAQVVLVGDAGKGDALSAVLAELLTRPGVTPEFERRERFRSSALLAENQGDASVWVFVALTGPRQARLYFRGPFGNRFLLRELTLRDGLDELGRELIAQVVETSTVALLRSEAGVTREEARRDLSLQGEPQDAGETQPEPVMTAPSVLPRSSGAPTHSSGSSSHLRFELGGRAALQWSGAELGFDPRIGVEAALARRTRTFFVRGRLVVERAFGQTLETANVTAGVRTTALRGGLDVGAAFGVHAVAVGVGAGADFTRVSPHTASDVALALAPGATSTTPALRLEARYELTLGAFLGTAGLFADAPLADTHYDVREGDTTTRVDPWAVRPGVALTLGWCPAL